MGAFTQQEVDLCEQPAILAEPIFVLREEIDILAVEGDNVTNSKPAGCDSIPASPVSPVRMQNACSTGAAKTNQMIEVRSIQQEPQV
jgi:hypothetical protein